MVWVLALVLGLVSGGGAAVAAASVLDRGAIGGARYVIEIPANWNGSLLLWSHGYVTPCNPADPACNPPGTFRPVDPITPAFLKAQGYALAGSAYRTSGWAIKEALEDQIALLDYFDATYRPTAPVKRTVAWGHSLGGIITAGLVQRHGDRFAGAMPMCGVLAGGVGVWNTFLDVEFIFKTLLAPDSQLQLVHIANPQANLALAQTIAAEAQGDPTGKGRARLALAAALGNVPGWFTPLTPEPSPSQFAVREANQYQWFTASDFRFAFALRAELEARARGNPSWNTGVNYSRLLARSSNKDEVVALYAAAGLSLDDDLETLANTPRIAAQPAAVQYLSKNIVFNGDIDIPVLTVHTLGDGLVVPQNEQAYASVVADEGNQKLLRQLYVHRAGHCAFTPAETIAALNALLRRIDTGQWSGLDPNDINSAAAALGPDLNVFTPGLVPTPSAFVSHRPSVFLRPFIGREDERDDRTDPEQDGLQQAA
jgi:pimeloyl-ACP methyl ester carboxylesterase